MKSTPIQGIAAVICTVMLLFVAAYAQFQISPIAHLIMPAYGMDHTQFSILFSSTMIAGIVLSLVAGLLCDKFGTRAVIAVGGVATTIALIARIFAADYTTLFICMAAAGFVVTFINANIAKIMGSWFTPDKVGVAVGIGLSGTTLGMAVAMSTSALFDSIQSLFVFTAIVSVVATIAWVAFYREGPYAPQRETAKNNAGPALRECLKVAAKSRNVWVIGCIVGLVMAATMFITTFLPQVLQTLHGLNPASAGMYTSLFTFGNLAGTIITPIIVMKLHRFKPVMIAMALLSAVGTFIAWQLSPGFAMGMALFLAGIAMNGIIVTMVAQPILLPEIGPIYAGTAGGIVATLQLSGAVIIPSYIVVPLVGANYPVLYAIAAALCLIVAVLICIVPDTVANQATSLEDPKNTRTEGTPLSNVSVETV